LTADITCFPSPSQITLTPELWNSNTIIYNVPGCHSAIDKYLLFVYKYLLHLISSRCHVHSPHSKFSHSLHCPLLCTCNTSQFWI